MGRKAATLYDLPLMFLFGNNGYIENDNRQCAEQCRNNNTHTAIPFLHFCCDLSGPVDTTEQFPAQWAGHSSRWFFGS